MKTVSLINHIITYCLQPVTSISFIHICSREESRAAEAGKLHRYAVLIAARNEEAVIAN